jgi:hypothetical protein
VYDKFALMPFILCCFDLVRKGYKKLICNGTNSTQSDCLRDLGSRVAEHVDSDNIPPVKKGISFQQFQPLRESFDLPSFQVALGEKAEGQNTLSKKGPFL